MKLRRAYLRLASTAALLTAFSPSDCRGQTASCMAFDPSELVAKIVSNVSIYGVSKPLTREITLAAERSDSLLRLETRGFYFNGRVEIVSEDSFSFRTATGVESFAFAQAPTLIHAESPADFERRLMRLRSELPTEKRAVFDAAMGAKLNGQRVRIELHTPADTGGLFVTEIFGSVTSLEDHLVESTNLANARETLRFYIRPDQSRDWFRKPKAEDAIHLEASRDILMAKTVINHAQPIGFDVAEPYLKTFEVLTTAAEISPAHLIGPLGWFYLRFGGPRDIRH